MAIPNNSERLAFRSAALDEMVGGGLLRGSTSLISGAPGVGKTTLGLQFLMAGIDAGQAGLLVSFEEFPASLIRDALQLGWDLKALEKNGRLSIIFTSPGIFLESLKIQQGPIAEIIQTLNPERVVLDSMAHFQRLSQNPLELREMYNILINAIKRQDMTSLLLDEAANVLTSRQGKMAALPFLVDNVVLLRYVEVDSRMNRAIAVLKMRGSTHEKEIRRFAIKKKQGLVVGDPFTGQAGILSGTSRRTA